MIRQAFILILLLCLEGVAFAVPPGASSLSHSGICSDSLSTVGLKPGEDKPLTQSVATADYIPDGAQRLLPELQDLYLQADALIAAGKTNKALAKKIRAMARKIKGALSPRYHKTPPALKASEAKANALEGKIEQAKPSPRVAATQRAPSGRWRIERSRLQNERSLFSRNSRDKSTLIHEINYCEMSQTLELGGRVTEVLLARVFRLRIPNKAKLAALNQSRTQTELSTSLRSDLTDKRLYGYVAQADWLQERIDAVVTEAVKADTSNRSSSEKNEFRLVMVSRGQALQEAERDVLFGRNIDMPVQQNMDDWLRQSQDDLPVETAHRIEATLKFKAEPHRNK